MKKKAVLGFLTLASIFTIFSGVFKAYAQSYVNGGVNIDVDYGINEVYRSNEYRITDAPEINQSSDTINLMEFEISTDELKNNNYKTLVLIFRVDIKEKDDGYQELFVYTDENTQLVGGITKFEHGPGKTNKNYTTYEFYAEIDVNSIINNTLTVRYGANGWFADDWYNKNFGFQLCASKATRVYSNLLWVTNGVNKNL